MERFSQPIGQERALELLERALDRDRIAPAYLFVGTPGIGRGLTAKYFSQLLLSDSIKRRSDCYSPAPVSLDNHPDFLAVQPTYLDRGQRLTIEQAEATGLKRKTPPQIRIEQIREISQFLSRPPLKAPRSVVAIADAQTMTEAAANALLKTLEEPGKATLILIAPSMDSLLPTLVSRCQRIPFYRLSAEQMERILQNNGYGEILAHSELLAIAQGSPGEAIASFERFQAIPPSLRQELTELPQDSLHALELARAIDRDLDLEVQLWLINYLQHIYWQNWQQKSLLDILEKARRHLLNYVQPRLVWECTLLSLYLTKVLL